MDWIRKYLMFESRGIKIMFSTYLCICKKIKIDVPDLGKVTVDISNDLIKMEVTLNVSKVKTIK